MNNIFILIENFTFIDLLPKFIANLFPLILQIISVLGIIVIFQWIVYRKYKYSFEKISVIQLTKDNREDYLKKVNYDDIGVLPHHQGSNMAEYLIGPEEYLLEDISIFRLSYIEKNNNLEMHSKKINIDRNPNNLVPQRYILLSLPVSAMSQYKITFKIHHMPGEYTFTDNMKNGFNDKMKN